MRKLFIIFLMIAISSINVMAFGVSSSYYRGNPLILGSGETQDVTLTIQNMAGATEDLKVKVEVISGNEVAKVADASNLYDVPAGRDDIKTNLKINIPKDAQPGEEWNVMVEFKTISEKEVGMVSLGLGTKIEFKVIATEAPKKEEVILPSKKGIQPIFFLLIVIAIIGILTLLMFKSLSKKPVKKKRNKKF